uniref:Uncharacterized protein n=1 Tax=Mustela putorius furo TaxID=9669 RepID=M3Z7C3_MUSPF
MIPWLLDAYLEDTGNAAWGRLRAEQAGSEGRPQQEGSHSFTSAEPRKEQRGWGWSSRRSDLTGRLPAEHHVVLSSTLSSRNKTQNPAQNLPQKFRLKRDSCHHAGTVSVASPSFVQNCSAGSRTHPLRAPGRLKAPLAPSLVGGTSRVLPEAAVSCPRWTQDLWPRDSLQARGPLSRPPDPPANARLRAKPPAAPRPGALGSRLPPAPLSVGPAPSAADRVSGGKRRKPKSGARCYFTVVETPNKTWRRKCRNWFPSVHGARGVLLSRPPRLYSEHLGGRRLSLVRPRAESAARASVRVSGLPWHCTGRGSGRKPRATYSPVGATVPPAGDLLMGIMKCIPEPPARLMERKSKGPFLP